MRNIKRRLILLALTLTVLLVPTAVSAGTADDSVSVRVTAAMPGTYYMVDQQITATGDLVEKYYPELAKYEPEKGVSAADVLVAAHLAKYGNTDSLKLSYNKTYGSVSMDGIFGHITINCFYYPNNTSVFDTVNQYVVSDGDRMFFGVYGDNDSGVMYDYFTEENVKGTAGKPVRLEVRADEWGNIHEPTNVTIYSIDKTTGKLTEVPSVYKDGAFEVTFDQAGTYTLVAGGTCDGNYGAGQKLVGWPVTVDVAAADKNNTSNTDNNNKDNGSSNHTKNVSGKTDSGSSSGSGTSASSKADKSSDVEIVKTGDQNGSWLVVYAAAGLGAAVILAVLLRHKRSEAE